MKLLKINKINFFIYIILISIVGSLTVNPHSFFIFEVSFNDLWLNLNFITSINIARFFLPTILILIFITFTYKTIQIPNFKRFNVPTILIITFFLFLIFKYEGKFIPETLYYYIYFNIIFFTILLCNFDQKFILNKFGFIILLYSLIALFFIIKDINNNFLYFVDIRNIPSFFHNSQLLNNQMPRSTGVARILVLLFTFIYLINLTKKKTYFYFLSLIIVFLIISLQSRFSFLSLIYVILFFNIFIKKFRFINISKDIFSYLILPIIIINIFSNIDKRFQVDNRIVNFTQKENSCRVGYELVDMSEEDNQIVLTCVKTEIQLQSSEEIQLQSSEEIQLQSSEEIQLQSSEEIQLQSSEEIQLQSSEERSLNLHTKEKIIIGKNTNIQNFTTGRNILWTKVYKDFLNSTDKIFYGYGINSDKRLYQQSISNSFIYAFHSNGFIGIFIYILLCLYFIKSFLIYLLKIKNKNQIVLYAYMVIGIIMLRTFVENSFFSQPLDLLILLFMSQLIDKNVKSS
jgi:hypothetical protein